jgi:hypothetical protein
MSATMLAAATVRRPVAVARIALVRLTTPISSCVEPHQDTHQEAHQFSVSAGHSVAWPSASKRHASYRARAHRARVPSRSPFQNRPIGRNVCPSTAPMRPPELELALAPLVDLPPGPPAMVRT